MIGHIPMMGVCRKEQRLQYSVPSAMIKFPEHSVVVRSAMKTIAERRYNCFENSARSGKLAGTHPKQRFSD